MDRRWPSRLTLGFLLLLPGAAPAPTTPVAVQIVLAVDVSGSVDQSRF
jgi:hypothetical protein